MSGTPVRVNLHVALPIAGLALIILVIIIVQLCGNDDVDVPSAVATPGASATPGQTFTPGPSPTAGAATPTETGAAPAGGAGERDAQRQIDMAAIQDALNQYFAAHDEYPSTNGNIQSLCVFEDSDAGCALKEFLDPLPEDPLGEPAANGYFYSSTGDAWELYATREADDVPECDTHPDHLKDIDSVSCLKSGAPAPTP